MTPSAAGKGNDDRRNRAKFDPRWDDYEARNAKRIGKLRAKHLRDARRRKGQQ